MAQLLDSDYKAALALFAENKKKMSKQEFKEWLETFDSDRDGKISRAELQAAVRTSSINSDAKRNPKGAKGSEEEMAVLEFKKWLMKFDKDRDGRISRDELTAALRSRGVWLFPGLLSSRTLNHADANRSGYIDDDKEIKALMVFAEKTLGFKFQ